MIRRTFLLVALMSVVAVGCNDASGPGGGITGTYTLRTVNGQNVPFVLIQIGQTYKFEILSGQLVLNENGTFSESLSVRETENSTVSTETETTTGTWTRTNNSISFTDSENTTYSGAISDDTITFTAEQIVVVYRK